MYVRFLDGPRKGTIEHMEWHHAEPLIRKGYVEPAFGNIVIEKPKVAVAESAMVQPIAEQMVRPKVQPRKK